MPELQARCLVELGEIEGAEKQVLLLPAGRIEARDGRKWHNPDPADVVRRTLARAGETELVVDYEHQTDLAAGNGQAAPAAGWITDVTATADGIRATIRWTEKALAHIQAKEYRYLSPTFVHDKSGRVQVILRAALTNSPALDLPALATSNGELTMNEKLLKLLALFGLTEEKADDDAALDAAYAKAEELQAAGGDMTAVAQALGLAEDANQEAIVAECKSLKEGGEPDPAKFVSIDQFQEVSGQLKTLQDERTEDKATAAVDEGITAGKVSPAQRDWALTYAKSDLAGFTSYLAAAPVIVAPGAANRPNTNVDPNADLTADELAVCKAMGLTPDQYKAGRKDLLDRQAGESS